MNSKLSAAEQKAIADIKAIYGRLGDDAKMEAAKAVSFAEKHFGIIACGLLIIGIVIGVMIGMKL